MLQFKILPFARRILNWHQASEFRLKMISRIRYLKTSAKSEIGPGITENHNSKALTNKKINPEHITFRIAHTNYCLVLWHTTTTIRYNYDWLQSYSFLTNLQISPPN
ncbi:MAG: hypothetical protein BGP01_07365 [Paludibacter sp. 47-17]|nr:MAG: hypothetical protein BGP01_07365 [Paludibacter sp. 47-17]